MPFLSTVVSKIFGKNITTGIDENALSFIEDDNGYPVLRTAVVKATDLETLITALNGKIDTLDAVVDTIKDTIIDKVTVETMGVSDVFTLLAYLDAPGYGDEIDVSKYGMVRVHITKNNYFNGTITFQGLVSGSAYKNILVRNVNTGILVESIPSPNPLLVISEDYLVDVRGLSKIRIQTTYTTAGDVSATGRGEPWTEIQHVNIANDQPVDVQLSESKTTQHTFQDAATVAADGAVFTVDGYKTLVVGIMRTATSGTIEFKATDATGQTVTLPGIKKTSASYDIAVSTTGTAETWEFDISGFITVFMDITAIVAGTGSITVKGTAVA